MLFAITIQISTLTAQTPVAKFGSLLTSLCKGGCVDFYDSSSNNPTQWHWIFPGGTPPSSTAQNPTVCYLDSGSDNVTLIASNSNGSDTLTNINYIYVRNALSPPTPIISQQNCDTLVTTTDSSYAVYQWYFRNTIIPGATYTYLVIDRPGSYFVEVCNSTGCCVGSGIYALCEGINNFSTGEAIIIYPSPSSNGSQYTVRSIIMKL